MGYVLPVIPFVKLRFFLTMQQGGLLPRWKGSMLRGAFGLQLKKLACVYPDEPDCRPCSFRHACAYACIFEPCIDKKPPQFLRGLDTAPRPYTFYCPDFTENFSFDTGFQFDFTLIGTACAWYREAIIAILKMAQAGLSVRRHPFRVQAMHMLTSGGKEWQIVYDGSSMRSEPIEPIPVPPAQSLLSPLRLEFVSPLRVKINGKYAGRITFRQLTFQMLRRVLELAYFYAPDQPLDWEFNHLLQTADTIPVVDQHFQWADWERHSNRQETDMQLGGMLGHLTLEGDLEPWRELINAAHWLHIGKGTAFGLGRVEKDNKILSSNK